MADNITPAWKINRRNGPLDWWLGCEMHGYGWVESCMSCGIASAHNEEFHQKLARERGMPDNPDCDLGDEARPPDQSMPWQMRNLMACVHSVIIRSDNPQGAKFCAYMSDLRRAYDAAWPYLDAWRAKERSKP